MTKREYKIYATGDEGIHTGRDRYHVMCLTCGLVLHENTTGPMSYIGEHEREIKRGEVICVPSTHAPLITPEGSVEMPRDHNHAVAMKLLAESWLKTEG